ncbi:Ig-like domain-containing protein [Halomonas sp. JS92-SW72]|uniref:Ig-like domain-containing protein n=1 Tax=Halomonas sp. JS92-SW72 TaxID=2306583 RepID=UPI000E5A3668|nr:Ig-like domain-containing protein [Halomonas sp. JS92-SW72]AXY42274.1 tandem-95 repeat protein [Halomonas sp. JS92-SW72]
MSTSPESDDLDTDLLETRFESSRSLPRGRAVDSEERRGLSQAPPDLDDAEESEAGAIAPPADADDALPAEETDTLAGSEGNEEPPAVTADTTVNEPAIETSAMPTEDTLVSDEGSQPDEGPQQAGPDDTAGVLTEESADDEVTETALQEEETADGSTTEPETKVEATAASPEQPQDPTLLDDGELFTFQALEEDTEDSSVFLAMSSSTTAEAEPITATSQFQQGQNGYAGVVDTFLYEGQPRANRSSQKTLTVDSEERRGEMQALVRFENIFGDAAGQIPLGATILSATLELRTTTSGDGATLHRMLRPWSDGDTWDSLQNGIQADGIEAMIQSDLNTGFIPAGTTRLDVTTSLQAWADGENNLGWAFLPLGPDGWSFDSAEGTSPPRLIVEYRYTPVAPVNNSPVAQDDTASTLEGTSVQISVLENDSDPDGDPLTVGEVTQPSNGSASINPDGTITYTPEAGFFGTDSFTYRASDGQLLSDPATVTVTVEQAEPVNNPPVANDDTAKTTQGLAVQIAVLENDSDPDGDPLMVGELTQPSNGSVTVNADGTITYTPDAGFFGTDSFTYRASDGQLLSDPATVVVTVEQVEEPPPGSTTLQFQHGSGGYFGVVDTYLHQSQPTTSRASSTTLVVDSVDKSGEVQALLRFDDLFGSSTGKIPLGATILSATLVVQTTSKGDGATLHRMLLPWSDSATWNSLENGIQADGIEAMIQSDLNTGFIPAGTTRLDVTTSLQAWADGQANHGWALLPLGPDGWKFHSAEGSTPPTLIVEYTTADGGPINRAPLASDDTASTTQGLAVQIAVLENDSDPDGDPLTVGAVTLPGNGSVSINADGTITYTPDVGFIGTDSFTYRAYDGQLLSDPAMVLVIVSEGEGPPPLPLETSYIATSFGTSDRRNFEHTNATKSFFHNGQWWAVLPEQTGWHVYRFDGSLPDPGTMGGWVKSSPTMLTSGRRADIAWDDATDTLYVLNFGPTETGPRLYQLGYNAQTGTFEILNNIQLAGSGGKLTGAEWQRNTEMALGLDQNGSPVVAMIGPSAAGGEKGLKLAYPTSDSLESWRTVTLDPGPSTTAGSNGDNKVDFVAFQLGGIEHVGLVYGDDATGLWKFAYQPTPSSPAGYGSGWTIETVTDAVVLDNHLAVLWDGSNILMTMKDDRDALWAIKGMPGEWEAPVLVHSATHSASRPTLAYDEDNQTLFIFYQENTNQPYGDIYFKASSTGVFAFDPSDPGTLFITSTRDGENMSDPQMPTHAVGEATDGMFFVFARNQEAREIWYNDFQLSDDWLIA